jgi:hypothetical protein
VRTGWVPRTKTVKETEPMRRSSEALPARILFAREESFLSFSIGALDSYWLHSEAALIVDGGYCALSAIL